MTRLVASLIALALAAAAAPAGAAVRDPAKPPPLCAGNLFADQIGSHRSDLMRAGARPERLWGMGGNDLLIGSDTRATCLFGGRGADELASGSGGGVAIGEPGPDLLIGGRLDDVLLGGAGDDVIEGGPGNDVINGNGGVDGIDAGPGDDRIRSADGVPEVVDCGDGQDTLRADGSDVPIHCEHVAQRGGRLPKLSPRPSAASMSTVVHVRFRVHRAARAGAYRLLLTSPSDGSGCVGGPRVLARVGRVHRGQAVRVELHPPAGGWCRGQTRAALVLVARCQVRAGCPTELPGKPLARLRYLAEGPSAYTLPG